MQKFPSSQKILIQVCLKSRLAVEKDLQFVLAVSDVIASTKKYEAYIKLQWIECKGTGEIQLVSCGPNISKINSWTTGFRLTLCKIHYFKFIFFYFYYIYQSTIYIIILLDEKASYQLWLIVRWKHAHGVVFSERWRYNKFIHP